MSSTLNEEKVNSLVDLFEACQLLQQHDLDLKGISCLEDAKCRLLKHIQDTSGAGKQKHSSASELMQCVLEEDQAKRQELAALYCLARDHLATLPRSRRAELDSHVQGYAEGLGANLERIQKSDCAILIAGEVSAGKSSLLNLLLGQDLLPTSLLSCTSVICELRYSTSCYAVAHPTEPAKHPVYIDLNKDEPDKQLAPYVHKAGDRSASFPYKRVELFWPLPLLQGGIVIVDSPGIGESREMTEMVKQYLSSAFAFIYVINSSNAGGLQPDRLQDLLAALVQRKQKDELSLFNPSSAIFVCNKWDQVPPAEAEAVKKDTLTKLTQCWPGLNPNQVYCLSTKQAARSLAESSFVTSDFSALLQGIEALLPISLQCKLENHYRWLSQVLRRSAFVLRVHMANETRSDAERHDLMAKLRHQLDKLEGESRRVCQDLNLDVRRHAEVACDQLVAHLASASTRARLLHWEPHECPDGEDWDMLHELLVAKVHKRIRREVSDWDVKNEIFAEIQQQLMQQFQEEFQLMEDQLSTVEGDMIGTGRGTYDTLMLRKSLRKQVSLPSPAFTLGQKLAIGFAAPVLLPLGVIAGMFILPVAGLRALQSKLEDMRLLREYRANKPETLSSMTDEILENFLEKSNLNKLIQDQLKVVTQNVETMINAIPKIIAADRAMIEKLADERRTTELSITLDYKPLYQKSVELQGKLDLLFALKIRKYNVEFSELEWDPVSPPIASGTFGDVYKATWTKCCGEEQSVAIKIPRETLDEHNVTEILMEEEIFRRLQHEHMVRHLGTAVRGGDSPSNHQLILLMECCETTLKSRIPAENPPNPGRLAPEDTERLAATARIACYGEQIAKALVYLHGRNFVHRDLKPQNILVTEADTVKLADVGQTRRESDISGTRCGTGCYSAPEVLAGLTHGCSADLFSYGMLLWELWYGRRAQDDLEMTLAASPKRKGRSGSGSSSCSGRADPEMAVMKGTRPSLASVYEPPEDWKDLIRRCWHQDPEERPHPQECVTFFKEYSYALE